MDPSAPVLVLAGRFDPTADLAVEELNRRKVAVFRADTADFPCALDLSARLEDGRWCGTLANGRRSLDLEAVRSVYYRRPARPRLPASMDPEARKVAEREARRGLSGLLTALPCRWLPPPGAAADAEHKPVQLRLAAEAGLRVPRTLITNDPAEAQNFALALGGQVVYKPFLPVRGTLGGRSAAVYASVVSAQEVASPDLATTAHLLQELVPKTHDVRLTAVAGHLFAAEIHTTGQTNRVDWRRDYADHVYKACTPPSSVVQGVQQMLDRLQLPYGAFDFAVTSGGTWWFLEVNPSGQYGFIEQATGLPITAAICDYLEGESR
ncbi:ATP-grasp ribosomal peptide maturase [Streptomyces chrestomyceticus]|uniref:ATP-grasp ribosomal peptide maturase n=1 Tax=Streptomyces chrestomyceticus TaxID=68185 RepID=UPI0033CA72FF